MIINHQQQSWKNQPLTVLGLSKSGVAVARYVASRGGKVLLSEHGSITEANQAWYQELEAMGVVLEMGGHSSACWTHADLVVSSPGIPYNSPVFQQIRAHGKTLISEVEFAYRQAPEIPWIAITGTNGKSTTTALMAWILKTAGLNAPACGNIGLPVTAVLDEHPDYLVAELSSYQLALSPTLKAKVAILTNFKPDHLDWHGSLDTYEAAKLILFNGDYAKTGIDQSPEWSVVLADDPISRKVKAHTHQSVFAFSRHPSSVAEYPNRAYVDENNAFILAMAGKEKKTLFHVQDLQLIGDHNIENVLSALSAAAVLGIDPAIITKACCSFKALEHRLEEVAQIGPQHVAFYNDSKATNTDAAISALNAFKSQRVILIAGGFDKMTPLDEFVEAVENHTQAVLLIGAAKERFAEAFKSHGYHSFEFADDLQQAVEKAYQMSLEMKSVTPVLLSPACASFDQFKNFEERGLVFKKLVKALESKVSTQLSTGVTQS